MAAMSSDVSESTRRDHRDARSTFPVARLVWSAAGAVLLLWFARQVAAALLLFFLAAVFAIALSAPVTWLVGRGWKRGLATAVVMLTVALALVGLGWLVVPRVGEQLTDLINNLPQYAQSISDRVSSWMSDYPALQQAVQSRSHGLTESLPSAMSLASRAARLSLGVTESVAMLIVVASLVVYLVANPRPLLAGYVRSLPPRWREPGVRGYIEGARMVSGWMKSNFVAGAIEAVVAGTFLTVLHVPGALVWAAFTFFAEFVPRIGGYLMAGPPVIVALSVSPMTAVWTALSYVLMNEVMGNLVVPRIRGETMNVHPALLIFVALALALAFGLVGALVATPLAGFLAAFYREFFLARRPPVAALDETVDAMLSARPPGAT
jgi:predicted PurR-regulated permease PerM